MAPDPANGIIIDYQLQYRSAPDSSFNTVLPNNTEVTDYEFRVAARTRVGRGAYTSITQATTSKLYCIISV